MQGVNFADKTFSKLINEAKKLNRPCVFLSHKKEDKAYCKQIGEYLKKRNIDIFLDQEDTDLQIAVQQKDPYKITERIKQAIEESTHMLCVISKETYKSMWVPFEVGYGYSQLFERKKISFKNALAVLTIKSMPIEELPEYLKIAKIIKGRKSFEEYILEINIHNKQIILESHIKMYCKQNYHPLDNILIWDK